MPRPEIGWFVAAGVFSVARWLLEFADIQYYDPESIVGYSGVLIQTGAGLATGVALLVLWRAPPVQRGALLIGVGGVAAIMQGLGNLFEDAFGWEWAEWGFFIGGMGMLITLALAGVLALTVRSPMRWSGLFLLLGSTGAMLGYGLLVMGLTWIGFSVWIYRQVVEKQRATVG
ncbi:MAG TPA: hypothetical protein VLG28_18005 [Acidimicrobiia bacterium]|jgi:hypothetical protein|nr:hypothetical protein [Acidimicrobiia bacterium]